MGTRRFLAIAAFFVALFVITTRGQVLQTGGYVPLSGGGTITGTVVGSGGPGTITVSGNESIGNAQSAYESADTFSVNSRNWAWGSGVGVNYGELAFLVGASQNSNPFSGGTQVFTAFSNGLKVNTMLVTAPTDSTAVEAGNLTRMRSSSTITPATGGAGNCGTAFAAAALTADCTIATLPAGMKLTAIYADVTAGFTCSATCTGTKVMQAGTAAGGTQVFAASLNVAATGQFGLADADLGSGMTRAAAIQGGLIGSWASTTIISVRFTSGTGNWGTGAATNVNAGSVKFTLITEQIK